MNGLVGGPLLVGSLGPLPPLNPALVRQCTGENGTGGRALVEVCTGMRMAGITRVSRKIRRNGDRCCWMELGAAEIPHGRFRNFADDKHLGASVRILGRSYIVP